MSDFGLKMLETLGAIIDPYKPKLPEVRISSNQKNEKKLKTLKI